MDHLVDSFTKNPVEEVRATYGEFGGRKVFGLRVWVEKKAGEWVPTRKGVSLVVGQYLRFRKAVERLGEALVEAGLLDREDLET